MKPPSLIVFLLTLNLAFPTAQGGTLQEQRRGQAHLTVNAPLASPPTIQLSTPLELSLTVKGAESLEVEMLSGMEPMIDWQVFETQPLTYNPQLGSWQQRWRLLPVTPGEKSLLAPSFRYREAGQEWIKVTWEPVVFQVKTEIKNLAETTPKEITSIEELPRDKREGIWWLLLIVLFLVALPVVWLVIHFRHQPSPKPKFDAAQRAQRQLARLARLPIATPRASQQAHRMLAKVLRRFVERRWQLPALRLTTPEFLSQIEANGFLSSQQQVLLGNVLNACDLAKFRPSPADAAAFQSLLQCGQRFVEEVGMIRLNRSDNSREGHVTGNSGSAR